MPYPIVWVWYVCWLFTTLLSLHIIARLAKHIENLICKVDC
jgi:hypothetical protein